MSQTSFLVNLNKAALKIKSKYILELRLVKKLLKWQNWLLHKVHKRLYGTSYIFSFCIVSFEMVHVDLEPELIFQFMTSRVIIHLYFHRMRCNKLFILFNFLVTWNIYIIRNYSTVLYYATIIVNIQSNNQNLDIVSFCWRK